MVQTTSHIFSGKVDIESNLLVGSSHLFVDTVNNRVGITTPDPDASLHVNGNAYVESNVGVGSTIVLDGDTGIITATEFRGDGSNLVGVLTSLQNATDQGAESNVTIELTNDETSLIASGNVTVAGNVTASTFVGDGSQLTGIATNLQSITDNGNVTSNTVQFTNTGTSLTASGTIEATAVQVNGLDVALDRDMTSNAARVTTLETDMSLLTPRVTDLEAANAVQEALINDLRTDVTSNTSRISSLETDRTSNTLRISLLESANIVQESLINDLRTDLTSNTARIVDLEAANAVQETLINDLRTDVTSNTGRIATLETDLSDNASRITTLETANTIQGSLINLLRTDVTDNAARVAVLETDLTDNVSRIETLETANTVQASLISTLESANAVQAGLITNLTNDLSSNDGRITTLETANGVQAALITNLTNDLSSNDSRITTLEAANAVQQGLITELQTANGVQATLITNLTTDLASNDSRITTLEAANTVQQGLITELQTANGVQAALITNLTTNLASNDSRITTLEAANTVQQGLITELQTANGVQAALITNLATDLASNDSRITALETTTGGGTLTLQGITDLGNTTTNVIQFSNATTGLVTTANVEVGGDVKISGLTAGKVPYVGADQFLKDSFITTTADATLIASNLDVTGNIFMRGEKYIVESESKLINDAIIGIANNNTIASTDIGILMQRPSTNVALIHHGGTDKFTIGYTLDDLEATDITNDTANIINVNILGNLYVQNVVTASSFLGDGTALTGVALSTDLTSAVTRITDLEAANTVQQGLITDLQTANGVQAALITNLTTDLASNDSRITTLEAANTVQQGLITELQTANGVQATLITNLTTDLASNDSRITTLEAANTVQQGLINELQTSNTNIWSNLASNSYRIGTLETELAYPAFTTLTLDGIANKGNTTSNVLKLTNATTGLVADGNVHALKFIGDGSGLSGIAATLQEVSDNGNVTSNTVQFTNGVTSLTASGNVLVTGNVTAEFFAGDGSNLTGINLQQVASVGHTTTTPLITSNTLTGKRTGAFDSKGDSTTEGEVFMDNLNAGEMTSQSIDVTQDGTAGTISNPIVITYNVSNWLVNGQSWNDVFHFTFVEGLTYVFDISQSSIQPQAGPPHIGYFKITGDFNSGAGSTPYELGVQMIGTQGTSGAQLRWTVPRGASSFQGGGGGSHPGPGYFWFFTERVTTGSVFPGQITERRIRVIPNPDQHILTGQTQIHGNLYSDSTIVSTNVEATDTVSSTRALISNVATMGTTKTFVVTVASTGSGNKYFIDGEQQATIELHENQTYIFDLSSSTLSTHPFVFQTTNANDGTTNGTNYETGITNTGTYASDQKRTFVVSAGAPTTLYYYCTAHSGMGGQISISPTAELVVSGRVVASGNVEADAFIGDGSQLTGISGATTSDLQAVTTNGATSTQAIQLTNTGTSLAASGAVTAASVSATGGMTAAYFTGDGSNVNIGEMTAETIPYVDANKQLRDSHITRTADTTVITSNLQVEGNLFVTGNTHAIDSENVVINDRIIGLANNNTSTTLDVGLILQYPQKNVAMIHHGTTSGSPHNGQLTLGYTQSGFEVDNITKDPTNNLTLNVWGHIVTQNNVTVGSQGSYYGDGTTLTGVALSADLTNNVTRIEDLETATIISNSSAITTGFTKGDIIYASADNVLNKLAIGGTDGYVLKVTSAANKTLGWAAESGGGGSGSTVWQQNGSDIHYSSGDVGINTSTPAFDLDVHGTANVGALTATSLSVGGQTLALASDLSANATRLDAIYTGSIGDIIYVNGANSLTKLGIGSSGQVLKVSAGGVPEWANESGGSGGSGTSSQWTTVNTNEIYYDGNVGIANTDPGHDLSVGSNLYVDDDGSNVLVVTGNTAMSALTLGEVSIVPSYSLDQVVNTGNVTANTVQFSNAITSLTAASNVVVTGNVTAAYFMGDGSNLTGISSTLQAITDSGNVTSNTIQFSNAITGLVTTANVEVGGEMTVSGNTTVSSNLTVNDNVTITKKLDYGISPDRIQQHVTGGGKVFFGNPIQGSTPDYYFGNTITLDGTESTPAGPPDYLKWDQRVLPINFDLDNIYTSGGYVNINCPTSGTIDFINSSGTTQALTCTENGIPFARGEWLALYYRWNPNGVEGTTMAASGNDRGLVLVDYRYLPTNRTSKWILLAIVNSDVNSCKWLPGCTHIPRNMTYSASHPLLTYPYVFRDCAEIDGLALGAGWYWFKDHNMTKPEYTYFRSDYWALAFSSKTYGNASFDLINKGVGWNYLRVQSKDNAHSNRVWFASKQDYATRGNSATSTSSSKSGYLTGMRVYLGAAGGHGIYSTSQSVCNWGSAANAIGAGWDGVNCGTYPNNLIWGTGQSNSAQYTNITSGEVWEIWIYFHN